MKIFMVGATGRTGKWILQTALAQGHDVTALVRAPIHRLNIQNIKLSIIRGDVRTTEMSELLEGHEVIFSALNSAIVADGTRALVTAATKVGVARFVGLAGGGILQLDEEHLRRERPGYPELFVRSSAEHLAAWEALKQSSLNWTLFCTPDIVDAPPTGRAQTLENYMPDGGRSVAAGDIAQLFVRAAEKNLFLNTRVGLNEP